MLAKAIAAGKNIILSNYLKQYIVPSAYPSNEFMYEHIIDPIALLDQAALAASPFPLPKTFSTVKQFWTYKKSAGDIPTFPVTVFQCYVIKTAYAEILQLLHQVDPSFESTLPKTFEQLATQYKSNEIIQKIQSVLAKKTKSVTQLDDLLTAAKIPQEKIRRVQSWFSLLKNPDSLYFNHYGKVGAITTIPFHQAMAGHNLNSEQFRNKIILVGYSENIEPEKNQGFYTNFSSDIGETISSTEIAATAVANLIDDNWLKHLPLQQQFLLILIWSFLLNGVCRLFKYTFSICLILALSVSYFFFVYYSFTTANVWFPLFIPVMLQSPIVLIVATVLHFLKKQKGSSKYVQSI